jgi:hypothetical protein
MIRCQKLLSKFNLCRYIKVAMDFYAQGWCDEAVTFSPSEFFVTGGRVLPFAAQLKLSVGSGTEDLESCSTNQNSPFQKFYLPTRRQCDLDAILE